MTHEQLQDAHIAALREIVELQATIDEQVEENRGLRRDVLLMQKANAELRAEIAQLQAQLATAKREVSWTTQRPTKPGWYWWRCAPDAPPKCEEVRILDGLGLSWYGGLVWLKIDIKGGQWAAGPIPEPKELA